MRQGLWSGIISLFSLVCASAFSPLIAQTDVQGNQIVPIPGPQAYSEPHPVDAIVTDSQGNMREETYTYYPNYYSQDSQHPDPNVVIINNTQQVTSDQYGGTSPSLFFPGFALGFLFAGGWWCDYDGHYWDGYRYGRVNYNNWNGRWNNYWNRDWNNRWNNHWNNHHNDRNWKYRDNKNWNDHTGKERGYGHHGSSGGQGGRGGGGHGGGHGGHGGGR